MRHDENGDQATELATTWTEQLRRTGHVRVRFEHDDERDLFRRAGRRAGRMLNRPVRTVVTGDQVHVMLNDWMDNPLRHRLEASRTRKAIDAAFAEEEAESEREDTAAQVTPIRRVRPHTD
ncbi:hypothetical protein [Spirillospora sp. NPDC029432]|uniref:hypothetical protein n=1 Tax=Spirillospora sp. NPDC029432 TaxID=3154599 RepID=UPI003451BA05